jgi:hypothetical protein
MQHEIRAYKKHKWACTWKAQKIYKGMAQQKQCDTKIGHKNNIQNAKEGIIIALWSVKGRYDNNSAKWKGRHNNNNVKEWFNIWWNKTNKKTNIVIRPKKGGAQGHL